MVSPDAKVYGLEKGGFGDIKTGDYVASRNVRGTDGQIQAVERRILPDPTGGIVHVTYKDGESGYIVGPGVLVLA